MHWTRHPLATGLLVLLLLTVPSIAWTAEPDPVAEFARLNQEAARFYQAGNFAQAEPLFRQALAIVEQALGPSDPLVAKTLNNLALVLKRMGNYEAARPLYERALAIDESAHGPDHPEVATDLNNLANLLKTVGDYAGARPLYERALTILERALGPAADPVASTLINLGSLLNALGDYAGARPLYERALAIKEQTLGPAHPEVAASLNNLAVLLETMAEYEAALPLHERALTIKEQALGPAHPDVALSLNNLAGFLKATGDYRAAQPLYARALAIWEQTHGPDHPSVAVGLNNLALMREDMGDVVGARPLYERALAIRERTFGPNHPDVAISLSNLAAFLEHTGDAVGARPLYERALAITERTLGPDHPDIATPLNNLGKLLRALGDHAAARLHLERALAIWEGVHGADHPNVAIALNNLGGLMLATDDVRGARSAYERALAIRERALGPDHIDIATSLSNLATAREAGGDLTGARPLLERGLSIWEHTLGEDHLDVAASLNALADLLDRLDDRSRARQLYERARRIYLRAIRTNFDLDDKAHRGMLGWARLRGYASLLARIARAPARDLDAAPPELDAFVVAEQARGELVQRGLAQAAARSAAADPATADLARQVQELRRRRQALWKELTTEYGKSPSNAARVAAVRHAAQQAHRDLVAATDRLLGAFPRYAELVAPEQIDTKEVQTLLRPDEAVVTFLSLEDRLLAWVVRPGRASVYRDIEITREELSRSVERVRDSIDQRFNPELARGRLKPFDVAEAHRLYRLLLQPFELALTGVHHLFVVPDDALTALPFAALVTRPEGAAYQTMAALPSGRAFRDELSGYADLAWLAKAHAISILPSATSLRAVRQHRPAPGIDGEALIAFGDPLLQGHGAQRGGRMPVSRGAAIAVEEIRQMAALPGTRDELLAVAHALGADPAKALHLGAHATKSVVMALNASGRLGRAKVIAFATHGLMAGEMTSVSQPALVLTPPATPTEQDDGLLSLDDVLKLRLTRTDWVVLSACNTAAEDDSGENLSGLARGFHFAGAPALLVSHWSVDDQATRALMTEVFRRYAGEGMARAEAVRQGMLALMRSAHGARVYFAHPFAWAPFFVVGDGGGPLGDSPPIR